MYHKILKCCVVAELLVRNDVNVNVDRISMIMNPAVWSNSLELMFKKFFTSLN